MTKTSESPSTIPKDHWLFGRGSFGIASRSRLFFPVLGSHPDQHLSRFSVVPNAIGDCSDGKWLGQRLLGGVKSVLPALVVNDLAHSADYCDSPRRSGSYSTESSAS